MTAYETKVELFDGYMFVCPKCGHMMAGRLSDLQEEVYEASEYSLGYIPCEDCGEDLFLVEDDR